MSEMIHRVAHLIGIDSATANKKKSLILFTPFGDRDPNPAENVGD